MSNSNYNPSKRVLLAIQEAQKRNKPSIGSTSHNNDQNRNEHLTEENSNLLNEDNNYNNSQHSTMSLCNKIEDSTSSSLFSQILKDTTNIKRTNNPSASTTSSTLDIKRSNNHTSSNVDVSMSSSHQPSSDTLLHQVSAIPMATVAARQGVVNSQSSALLAVPSLVAATQHMPPTRVPSTAITVSTLRPAPAVQAHNANLNATASSTTVPSKSSCSKIEGRVSSIALTRDVANLVLALAVA